MEGVGGRRLAVCCSRHIIRGLLQMHAVLIYHVVLMHHLVALANQRWCCVCWIIKCLPSPKYHPSELYLYMLEVHTSSIYMLILETTKKEEAEGNKRRAACPDEPTVDGTAFPVSAKS
jgi:hypothetical protein